MGYKIGLFLLLLTVVFPVSCNIDLERHYKLGLSKASINQIAYCCPGRKISLNLSEQEKFLNILNNGKAIGPTKYGIQNIFEIISSHNDTLKISSGGSIFKDSREGSFSYRTEESKLETLQDEIIQRDRLEGNVLKLKVLEEIFESYKMNEESIDSYENKKRVRFNISQLNPVLLTDGQWTLLLNYFLYYDPTDFSVYEYLKPIFDGNKDKLRIVCQRRLKRKCQWDHGNDYADSTIKSLLD